MSLALHPGQTHCVVGESGSGKSLTALSVMGLLPRGARAAGSLRFAGAPMPTGRALARLRGDKIAMIFQEPMTSLNPAYTVGSQLTEAWRSTAPAASARRWTGRPSCCAGSGSRPPATGWDSSRTSSPAGCGSG